MPQHGGKKSQFWILYLLVNVGLLWRGVDLQKISDSPQQKPNVIWATPVNKFQQANQWNELTYDHIRRQWMVPDSPPAPAPSADSASTPLPLLIATPIPIPNPAPVPTPSYPTSDTNPSYAQPEPYMPPSPPSPSPYYPPAPSYDTPPVQPPNYYYYYYPTVQTPQPPSWKDLFKKEKEAFEAMSPGKHDLSVAQKVWISVLTPLIVVALIVPLAAILFSNFTITAKRSLGLIDMNEITQELSELAARAGAMLESDECIQRMICDLGSYTSAVPGRSYLLSLFDNMVPETMRNNMNIFKEASSKGSKAANCKRFKCSSWKY